MTDETVYQPLPMPHGRVRPAPPPLVVQQGALPPDLVEQARTRHDEAEVLVLPREADARLQDGDPTLAIYDYGDGVAVESLRRSGVRADFLSEHRIVVAQFTQPIWVDFAVLVSAAVTAEVLLAIARHLVGLVRNFRNSGIEPALDLTHGRLGDKTYLRATGADSEAVLKAYFARLAADVADPATKEALLRLAAGADSSTAFRVAKSKTTIVDSEGEADDQDDTHEAR
jgi:hypothetical protein